MKPVTTILLAALLAILLPFAGVLVTGSAVRPSASFEWPAFLTYALIIVAVVAPFVWRVVTARGAERRVERRAFPWWGWAGLALVVIAWVLAWTRLDWFAAFQLYTFTPLWVGYILVVNALTFRRSGHCLLLDRPRCFLALFPASAVFWWYFEYINRYVGNWFYVGVESLGAFEYFVHATISFSTVLPAVLSTQDRLASGFLGSVGYGLRPRIESGAGSNPLYIFWPVRFAESKVLAWVLLLLGAAAFFGIGMWP